MTDTDPLTPAAFALLAAELQAQPTAQVTSETIVRQLADWVVEADEVSLTTRASGTWTTLAATGDLARRADELQYELDEGPCRDAATHTDSLRSGDVASDARWPQWGPRAAGLGVASLLSLPLLRETGPASALNLYSRTPHSFRDRDELDQCLVYAVHAANALSAARASDDLHTAMTTRHTIGMAQGIVMERYGLDQQQSFELLRRLSSTSNTKLRVVADSIVRTRQVPSVDDDAVSSPG
jgi:hypothetical protein